jgi:hypothetical protein
MPGHCPVERVLQGWPTVVRRRQKRGRDGKKGICGRSVRERASSELLRAGKDSGTVEPCGKRKAKKMSGQLPGHCPVCPCALVKSYLSIM